MQQLTTTPRGLIKIIPRLLRAGLIPMLLSAPGVGKSSVVHAVAYKENCATVDTRLSTHEPQDLNGYPVYDTETKIAAFIAFSKLFPIESTPIPAGKDGWIMFLDEFTSIDESMQAATYKILLDRMVGQERLHPRCHIVLAGNRLGDGAVASELGSAIYSRVVGIHVEANAEEWIEDFALPKHLDPRVIAYISANPSKISTFDPEKSMGQSFGCPRTWFSLSEYMRERGDDVLDKEDLIAITGIISQELATPFTQFCKIYTEIVSFQDVLNDPLNCPFPTDPPLQWATVAMVQDNTTVENFTVVLEYIKRLPIIQKILFFRGVTQRLPELVTTPEYITAALEVAKYLRK